MFSKTSLWVESVFYLPVVSDDGSRQHTCEQPTKLSQSVKEGPVVCFHIGALGVNTICAYKEPLTPKSAVEKGKDAKMFGL